MRRRTLLYCPTYRLEPETVQTVLTQDWTEGLDVVFTRDNPNGEARADIHYAHRKAQTMCLASDYSQLFIVESDMVVPTDALSKLAALDVDIAYGLYVFRTLGHDFSANVGTTLPGEWINRRPDLLAKHWGQPIDVIGVGFGCILIQRRVLEALTIRDGGVAHSDWWLAADAQLNGFRQVCHLGVVCGHKGTDGMIWWPQQDGTAKATISEAREVWKYTGNGYIAGLPARDFEPAEWKTMPESQRVDAQALGVMQHIQPEPGQFILDGRFKSCQQPA